MTGDRRHNVLLITIDALRADHVGPRAGGDSLTPAIDGLKSQAVDFGVACSPTSYTWGTFASLFLSAHPGTVTSRRGVLTTPWPTLAEIMKANGYATAGLTSNPFISASFGYARGFDHFDDGMVVQSRGLPSSIYPALAKMQRFLMRQPYVSAAVMNRKAIAWLAKGRPKSVPFFMWLHYMDVHGPYQSKRGFAYRNKIRAEWLWHKAVAAPGEITPAEHRELQDTYREEVVYTDTHVGALLDVLHATDLCDDTVIVLCSDHGDEFAEHGRYAHWRQLYEELVRVPLVIRHPQGQRGHRVGIPVSLVDVLPTLCDLLELQVDRSQFVGQSLARVVLSGDIDGLRDFVLGDAAPDRDEEVLSIRTDRWKLIVDGSKGGVELYDLAKDPGETTNVADAHSDLVQDLEARLRFELGTRSMAEGTNETAPEWSRAEEQAVLSRLKALGYVDWVEEHKGGS